MQFNDYKVKQATKKACNTVNIPPKSKHIRTIIIRSYEGGIPTFYSELSKTIESENPLQQYKSILTLHKVLREGNKHLIQSYLDSFFPIINRIVNSSMKKNIYFVFQEINKHYFKFMQLKCVFHKKEPLFLGNFAIPNNCVLDEEYYSDQKCLTIISYMMDLLDYLLVLPLPIIQNYSTDILKLDCCIPLILDSYELFKNIVFFMNNLAHIEQNESVFTFLYERFKKLYLRLKELYHHARNNQYIVSLIDVPILPPLPTFRISEQEKREYLLKHPHSVSHKKKGNDMNTNSDLHLKQVKRMEEETKKKEEMKRISNDFLGMITDVFNSIVPDYLEEHSPEFKLERMIQQLMKERNAEHVNWEEFNIHLWKTMINSKYLLNEKNLEYVFQNENEENVLNVLLDYQVMTQKVKDSFHMNDGFDDFQKTLEHFISQLSYSSESEEEQEQQHDERNEMLLFDYLGTESQPQIIEEENVVEIPQPFNEREEKERTLQEIQKKIEELKPTHFEEMKKIEENNQKIDLEIQEEIEKVERVIQQLNQVNQHEENKTIEEFKASTQELLEFLKIAKECEEERILNGKQKSKNLYFNNEVWSEGLLSCAKYIVECVECISESMAENTHNEQNEKIFVFLKQCRSYCSQLISVAKVSMNEFSPLLKKLEQSLNSILNHLKTVIHQLEHEMKQQSKNELKNDSKYEISKRNGIESKKEIMESEIKVLQLQKELEQAQNYLYSLRKDEYH